MEDIPEVAGRTQADQDDVGARCGVGWRNGHVALRSLDGMLLLPAAPHPDTVPFPPQAL
jgi:hypothetical protein